MSRPSPGVRFLLEPVDLPAAIPRRAAEAFARLAAQGAPVVLTASATPTAAVAPLAAERDVLVIHQGAVTARVAALGPLVLHLRAPLAPRVDALTAVAHDVGLRRLGLLAAGDEFGKAVRARLAPRWRAAGATLAVEVSTGLEDPDLPGHLRRLTRAGVDGVCLAFRGLDLGDLAVALRAAGYAGPVLALDDDPAALLAGGPALEGALVVADAFLPEPGAPSERFARAYEARFKRPPSRYAANAYDAVGLVAEALRTARQASVAPPGGSRLRAALLERQRLPSVYGGELVVRDDGTLGRPLALLRVEHGSPVLVRYLPVEAPAP